MVASADATAYADILTDHLDFLADGDATYTATRTYPGSATTFTLTVDSQNHPMRSDDGGTFVSLGDSIYGFIDPAELTPAINDQVTVLGKKWRVVRAQPIRILGSTVGAWDVELTAIENGRA